MVKKKVIYAKAKKKTAIAKGNAVEGKGKIRINSEDINIIQPEILKKYVMEPILICETPIEWDMKIEVKGGGRVSQMSAARSVIAKLIIEIAKKDKKLKRKFIEYDRVLLIDDPRRKEAKKPLGKGARARKQMSKR